MKTSFKTLYPQNTCPATARPVKLKLPAPNLVGRMYEEAVLVEDGNLKILHMVVPSKTVYNTEEGRLDTVIVLNEENISIKSESRKYCSVWFEEAFSFISYVEKEGPRSYLSSAQKSYSYLPCKCVNVCFVKWCEIRDDKKLTVDAINKDLQCIRLRWQRTIEKNGRLTAGSEFGLIRIESI